MPEAQLIIKQNKVTIHPIAGTFRRTGDDKKMPCWQTTIRRSKRKCRTYNVG